MKRAQLVWIGLAVAGLVALVVLGIVVISSSAPDEPAPAATPAAGPEMKLDVPGAFVVKKNGGWCWFQDERAIVDGGKLLVGTAAGTTRDGTNAGDVQVTTFELDARKGTTTTLHPKLQSADHASPSIVRLADGRYLSAYTRQGKDSVVRWRVTEKPGDATKWKPEQKLEVEGKVTYTNLALEPGEKGRLFNFYRGGADMPRVMIAPDGTDFADAGDWLSWSRKSPSFDTKRSTRPAEVRPYVRVASRGGKVHLLLTEDHPRSYDTSVYHGYLVGHALHDSSGAVLDDDIRSGEPVELTKLTRVYEGSRDEVPWIVDLDVDAEGHPFAAIVVQKDGQKRASKKEGGGKDLRYRFARWDGKAWSSHEIAHAGSALYGSEANFSGLVALVPKNPDVLFLSANVDPATGKAAEGPRRFELHRGVTKDRGKTWTFTAITKDSQVDNIRPIVPEWDGGTLILWLRGSYTSMARYDLDVIGMLDPGAEGAKGG